MSSTFGTFFKVSTFGESHGLGVGATVDGCPAGLALTNSDIQKQLDRRRPGQSALSTPRQEIDEVSILSGTEEGKTLGTPIGCIVYNKDQRPTDYGEMVAAPRPGHADFTYMKKYGAHAKSGGGRSSARETIGRVIGGAIAEKLLAQKYGIEIVAFVSSVGEIDLPFSLDTCESITRTIVDETPIRCPSPEYAARMIRRIEAVKAEEDSIGGIVTCVVRNVPAGFGEPIFDKLEALLAHAMLSLPATKGFEIGSGFAGTRLQGSTHNDPFSFVNQTLRTKTNNHGGTLGGISSGETIYFRTAFKPVATIGRAQESVDWNGAPVVLEAKGRHDPCVVPRAVPIVEAMTAMVLADAAMAQGARCSM